MNFEGLYSEFAFAGNPIRVIDSRQANNSGSAAEYSVSMGGKVVYRGRYSPPADIVVSDIAEAYAPYLPDAAASGEDPLILIESAAELSLRTLKLELESLEEIYSAIVFPGGVSRQNFRTYISMETDAFRARFCNYHWNFFLSTRTPDNTLVIPEDEMHPLFFILDKMEEIEIRHNVDSSVIRYQPERGVYALDIQALRRRFMREFNVLPSVFDVYVSRDRACRIVVERSAPVAESYRLKFRNSFDVYEIITVHGELTAKPEENSDDSREVKTYDPVVDDYTSGRLRGNVGETLSASIVVSGTSRLKFAMDMLQSEEVWLLDGYEDPVRVIPRQNGLSFATNHLEPIKLMFEMEVCEQDQRFMPEIKHNNGSNGIFTEEFTEEFK